MRKTPIIVAIAVAIPLLALFIVPRFINSEVLLQTAQQKVAEATGRQLTVAGDFNLNLFPSLSLQLEDVQFSNSDEGTEPNMASMDSLFLHIPWGAALSGELRIEKFVINNLQLLLEKSNTGTGNWKMAPASGTHTDPATKTSTSTTAKTLPSDRQGFPDSFDISLGQVEVIGGTVTFIDHQANTAEVISGLALQILLPSLDNPLQINGEVEYKQEPFTLSTTLDSPRQLLNGEAFKTELVLESQLANLSYKGNVATMPLNVTGELSVKGDSVKRILAWQNQPLQSKETAFNQFSLNARIAMTENQFALPSLEARLDELRFTGEATVALQEKPQIDAQLNLGILNLNPYLTEPTSEDPETEKTPIVWDDTAIDLSALSTLNASLKITSESLLLREIKLGENQFTLNLEDGVLNLTMDKFNAYQGSGTGKVTINSRAQAPVIASEFVLTGIDFQPLLTDAVGFDKVMGNGEFQWNVTTRGLSQKDFVEALQGTMRFDIKDGAVKGANLAAIAKSAKNAMTGNLAEVNIDKDFSDAEKTDFASLAGSFQIQNGVAQTNDIQLLNPLVRVTVQGDVNLPATNVDMGTRARLVSTIEGQGGELDASGFTVPVKIKGPFHDVKVKPDLKSLLKDNLGDEVKDKLTDKLKGLFGGG